MSPPARKKSSRLLPLWQAIAQRTRSIVLLGLVCVACSIGGVVLVQYAQHHSYFTATDIVVSTDGTLTSDEIKQWAGVAAGMNTVALDVRAVEQRLRQHPWVHTAVVTREFPQRVYLTIRERQPVARIRRPEVAYLDGNGDSFVAPASGAHDLPYVSGLERVPLETPSVRTVLAGVRLCLLLIQEWNVALSEIHWAERRGYTLFLSDRQIVIRLGQKIRPGVFGLLQRVLERWPPDRRATVFDARFTDQIVVSPLPLRLDKGKKRKRVQHLLSTGGHVPSLRRGLNSHA